MDVRYSLLLESFPIVRVILAQVLRDVSSMLAQQMQACTLRGGAARLDRDATLAALVKCLTRLGKWLASTSALAASDAPSGPSQGSTARSRTDLASCSSPSGASVSGGEPPPTSPVYWDQLACALKCGPGARKAPQWFLEQVLVLSGGYLYAC